jgi:hypothetical protein
VPTFIILPLCQFHPSPRRAFGNPARNKLPGAPRDFAQAGERIQAFLGPIWNALVAEDEFTSVWRPGGPWGSVVSGSPKTIGAAELRRFRQYADYKDSGVNWLGQIPAHWEVKRLKLAAVLNPPASEVGSLLPETEVSFVPMEAVGEYGGLDLSKTRLLGEIGSGYTYFGDGDVVVAKITPCFENWKGAHARDRIRNDRVARPQNYP